MTKINETFRPISAEQVPDVVTRTSEESTHVNPSERLGLQAFKNLWIFDDDHRITTYVGMYDRALDEDGLGPFEDTLTHVVDTDENVVAGETIATYRHTEGDAFYSGTPTVDWTETKDQYLRQGLGTRRIEILDQLTQSAHDAPLHSAPSWNQEDAAEMLWRRLVEAGKAEQYIDSSGDDRFRMKRRDGEQQDV